MVATQELSSSSKSSSMATNSTTTLVKSQPLHNFSLPYWGRNETNNSHRRCRRLSPSYLKSSSPHHQTLEGEGEGDSDTDSICTRYTKLETRKKSVAAKKDRIGGEIGDEKPKKKIIFRLPKRGSSEELSAKEKSSGGGGAVDGGEVEGSVKKPWNLRARRSAAKSGGDIGDAGSSKNGEVKKDVSQIQKNPNLEKEKEKEKEKVKFTSSLSHREVEDDIFGLTGFKPVRRPKKKAKILQQQLDYIFPGCWLDMITADSYKVADVTAKLIHDLQFVFDCDKNDLEVTNFCSVRGTDLRLIEVRVSLEYLKTCLSPYGLWRDGIIISYQRFGLPSHLQLGQSKSAVGAEILWKM
ncbi:hypothetical protein GIB67_008626, partial [Kingdonia uniflora]